MFIADTGIEVTTDAVFVNNVGGGALGRVVIGVVFEVLLRVLERVTNDNKGKPRYVLLSPICFCSITPVFYARLWLERLGMDTSVERGYVFPSFDEADGGISGGHDNGHLPVPLHL